MTVKVLLIGCGNMGYAMLKGWISADDSVEVHVVEPAEPLRLRAGESGARACGSVDELPHTFSPDAVVIAVKPQVIHQILPAYAKFARQDQPALFLSVAAGISMPAIDGSLGGGAPVIRCMPNTPAAIGAGMMVCCANGAVSDKQRDLAHALLERSGKVAFVKNEDLMDAVTAVSGSGPAYVFHFIECLAHAGLRAGLPEAFAAELALQTIYGAALLARESDTAASVLREQVTSPNGTTAAALNVLMGGAALADLLSQAVAAAKSRSVELGKA